MHHPLSTVNTFCQSLLIVLVGTLLIAAGPAQPRRLSKASTCQSCGKQKQALQSKNTNKARVCQKDKSCGQQKQQGRKCGQCDNNKAQTNQPRRAKATQQRQPGCEQGCKGKQSKQSKQTQSGQGPPQSGNQKGYRGGRGQGMGQGRGRGMGRMGQQQNQAAGNNQKTEQDNQLSSKSHHRDLIHALLSDHLKIKRTVKDIKGGIESVTTSKNPKVARVIQVHVNQMKDYLEKGIGIRRWDPLFQEIHKHHDKITMKIKNIKGGVKVIQTSDDPNVVLLIRQHAHHGVSEFVKDGFKRAHQTSPLPKGYQTPKQNTTPPAKTKRSGRRDRN